MLYYRPDGTKIPAAEAEKSMEDSIAFASEEDAVRYFDKKAADANKKANPGFFKPQGTADRAAHAYMQLGTRHGQDPGPNPNTQLEKNKFEAGTANASNERFRLQMQLEKGEITAFEYRKAMDALENSASNTFGKDN